MLQRLNVARGHGTCGPDRLAAFCVSLNFGQNASSAIERLKSAGTFSDSLRNRFLDGRIREGEYELGV